MPLRSLNMRQDAPIALVTGSSRGLGKNMALALAKNGTDIVVTYNKNKDEALSVVAEINALGRKACALQLDVSKSNTWDSFAKALAEALKASFGKDKFDFLVNNAGVDSAAPFMQTTEEQFDLLTTVHFKSVYFLSQKLVPLMNDGGRIVNISSGLARFSIPGYSAYASMKGAVEVMTRYMAKELADRKIAVNTVAPGAIETDFTKDHLAHPGAREMIASSTALGRVGVPDDIGGVVAFLCSEAGRWVNAQRLEASGGIFI